MRLRYQWVLTLKGCKYKYIESSFESYRSAAKGAFGHKPDKVLAFLYRNVVSKVLANNLVLNLGKLTTLV